MLGKTRAVGLGIFLTLTAFAVWPFAADQPANLPDREPLLKTYQAGNFKDAYEGLRKLALDPKDDPLKVSADLTTAINCLQRLGRVDEIDEFREGVITAHKDN